MRRSAGRRSEPRIRPDETAEQPDSGPDQDRLDRRRLPSARRGERRRKQVDRHQQEKEADRREEAFFGTFEDR